MPEPLFSVLADFLGQITHDAERAIAVLVERACSLVPQATSFGFVVLDELLRPTGTKGNARTARSRAATETLVHAALRAGSPIHIDRTSPLLESHRLSSVACVSAAADLPGADGEAARRLAAGVFVVETDIAKPPIEAAQLEPLRDLASAIGNALIMAQDASRLEATHTQRSFRGWVERWARAASVQSVDLGVMLVAVEGLSELNRRLGFEAGDRALHECVVKLRACVPKPHLLAEWGGSATAILFVGRSEAKIQSIASQVSQELHATESEGAWRPEVSIGFACWGALPNGSSYRELIAAAEAALRTARTTPGSIVAWSDRIPIVASVDPMANFGHLDDVSYQRIMAVWRLFGALSRADDLDQLLIEMIRAVGALLRADCASFWTQERGEWVRRVAVDLVERDGLAEPDDAEEAGIVAQAASAAQTAILGQTDDGAVTVRCVMEGTVRGVLRLRREPAALRLEPSDIQLLEALGARIGRVLEDVHLLEESRAGEERLRKQTAELRKLLRMRTGLLGTHERMVEIMRTMESSARSRIPILLIGETGTGKDASARLIHRLSGRTGPLVVVDCASIPASLLQSELFGHEKGAFTGAEGRRIGRFEEANGGTIFLDELGELPIELQPKLLRVLQDQTIRRVGGDQDIELDLRIVGATNRDLAGMVSRGEFREDLYFRLRVVEIALPPLRERGEDVIVLALYFMREYCAEVGRELMSFSPEAQEAIQRYSWPGNIRELQNRVRRAVVMSPNPEITAADLQLDPASVEAAQSALSRPKAGPRAPRAPEPRTPNVVAMSPAPPTPAPPAPPLAPRRAPDQPSRVISAEQLSLEESVADWFWQVWLKQPPPQPPPLDALEAFLLRAALESSNGNVRSAAQRMGTSPETFTKHLERLSDPAQIRLLRDHPTAPLLKAAIAEPAGETPLMDVVTSVVLRELLVHCRGNKSEMARLLGCARHTMWRQLRRLGILANNGRARARNQSGAHR
jgi:diguanylate cyclase (GGDEF)-like protein